MLARMTSVSQNLQGLFRIRFDGGSRGNPGPAAGAAVVTSPDGTETVVARFIGSAQSNNEAEYAGAILGLREVHAQGGRRVEILGDSKLVIEQLSGRWRVHSLTLQRYHRAARKLIDPLVECRYQWVPRLENETADQAVNDAIDQATGTVRKPAASYKRAPALTGEALVAALAAINARGGDVTAEELYGLRAGRDAHSRKRLPELKLAVSGPILSALKERLAGLEDAELAKGLRWYLRGLSVELAARKVKADIDVAHARYKR